MGLFDKKMNIESGKENIWEKFEKIALAYYKDLTWILHFKTPP